MNKTSCRQPKLYDQAWILLLTFAFCFITTCRNAFADPLPLIAKSAAQELAQERMSGRLKVVMKKRNRLYLKFSGEPRYGLPPQECTISKKESCELEIGPDSNFTRRAVRLGMDSLDENTASLTYQLVDSEPFGLKDVHEGLISFPYSTSTDTEEAEESALAGVACHSKAFSVEEDVIELNIHPETSFFHFIYKGGAGKYGGFKALNYETGAQVDALPSRDEQPANMLVSPTGRYVAFATHDCSAHPCTNSLKVSALDGADPEVCTSSSASYRPLAFSTDEKLLVASSAHGISDNRLVLCKKSSVANFAGSPKPRSFENFSWSNTTMGERFNERLTPRLHGSPPWAVDFAAISPDQTKILSGRADGQVVLWDLNGKRLNEAIAGNRRYDEKPLPFSFAEDGNIFRWRNDGNADGNGRTKILVDSLFPTKRRLELVNQPQVHSRHWAEPLQFHLTSKGLYFLILKPHLISIVHVLSGKVVAELPKDDFVNATAISRDGNLIAIAYPGEVVIWHLPEHGKRCIQGDSQKVAH